MSALFYNLSSERQLSYSAILRLFRFIFLISPFSLLPHLVYFLYYFFVYLCCLFIFVHILLGCISLLSIVTSFLDVVWLYISLLLCSLILLFIFLCLKDERVISLCFVHRLLPDLGLPCYTNDPKQQTCLHMQKDLIATTPLTDIHT